MQAANGHVIRVQIIFTNRAYHDFAPIHANSDLEVHAFIPAQLLGVGFAFGLHTQGCKYRSLGMVLTGYRRTKERKYTITMDCAT